MELVVIFRNAFIPLCVAYNRKRFPWLYQAFRYRAFHSHYNNSVVFHSVVLPRNPLQTAQLLCEQALGVGVGVGVASRLLQSTTKFVCANPADPLPCRTLLNARLQSVLRMGFTMTCVVSGTPAFPFFMAKGDWGGCNTSTHWLSLDPPETW